LERMDALDAARYRQDRHRAGRLVVGVIRDDQTGPTLVCFTADGWIQIGVVDVPSSHPQPSFASPSPDVVSQAGSTSAAAWAYALSSSLARSTSRARSTTLLLVANPCSLL